MWGLAFPNPLGIAAGFDKDARVVGAVLGMGLGFAEIGTVTPRPQQGNPRPRVFRLAGDRALINRLGFNNGGHAAALARLVRRPPRGIVGVNVGANKDAPDRAADYVEGIRCFYDVAGYFSVNVSSPNTPGLRDLQAPAALDDLLARVLAARSQLMAAGKPRRPIVVKLAPDLAEADLEPVVGVLVSRGVDGIAISNTTLSRFGVSDAASGARGRRAVGAPAVPPLHRHAGPRPSADAGAHSADRHRRHRLRAPRPSPRSRPAPRCCSSTPASSSRGRASSPASSATWCSTPTQEKLARIGDATGRRAEEWAARPLEA